MAKLAQMPLPLMRQLILRFGGALVGLVIAVCTIAIYREIYLSISLLAIAVAMGAMSIRFLHTAATGRYIVVEGVCQEVEAPLLRRKRKTIYISAPPHTIRIELNRSGLDIQPGDILRLYVACRTPVYDLDDFIVLGSYMAIDIRKGANT